MAGRRFTAAGIALTAACITVFCWYLREAAAREMLTSHFSDSQFYAEMPVTFTAAELLFYALDLPVFVAGELANLGTAGLPPQTRAAILVAVYVLLLPLWWWAVARVERRLGSKKGGRPGSAQLDRAGRE